LSYTTTRARVEKPNHGVEPSAAGLALAAAQVWRQTSSFDLNGLEQAFHFAAV
jgi:hypothetical protein